MTIAYEIEDLINQYQRLSSGHFFDSDTMRFFNSRLTNQYKRVNDSEAFFITTVKGPNGIRLATIRHARLVEYIRESDNRKCKKIQINTFGEFNKLTLAQAKQQLSKL